MGEQMTLRASIFGMMALCFTASSALAETRNVQDLHRQCTKAVATAEQIFCVAFISGVAEQMIANGQVLDQVKNDDDRVLMLFLSACTKASFGAMIQAFIKWAENHPDKWDTPRQLGVMAALRETWPCK